MAGKLPKGTAIVALSSRDRRFYFVSAVGGTLGLVVGIIGEQLQTTGPHGHTGVSGVGWLVVVLGLLLALSALANCGRLLNRGRRLAFEAEAVEAAGTAEAADDSSEGVPGSSA
ncbi:MAG TPA: hypothetical protein VGG38_20335 [Acidimicrobiales bacterium]